MKNNKYIIIVFILILVLVCTGCFENSPKNTNNFPFNNDLDDNTTIACEYGHSPHSIPQDFTYYYYGGVLNIPYTFYGGRVDSEVGLFIFIDGVVQQYSIEDFEKTTNNYMEIFNVNANSEQTYTLNITPNCGKKGDILKLNFVCIEFPSLNTKDNLSPDLQRMSTTITWKLSYLEDAETLATSTQKEFEIKTISNNTENYYENKTEFENESEKIKNTLKIENKTLKFILNSKENNIHFKTTIFINNKPISIDDNNNFIDYKINKYEKLTYEAKINDNNLKSGDIFYAISIKLDNTSDNWKSQIDVFKTDSILT